MADPLFINDLITQVINGQIRIPSFQRGFIWDADRVAHLMDSIYKGYPFGSLLFWRTKTPLQTERDLGPFKLPEKDPDYPIDYILDGQQRATSVFGVFQNQLASRSGEDDSWTKIYFDLEGKASAQDSQFLCLPDEEFDPKRHFPLRILLDPPAYRRFLKTMEEAIADQVDELYKRFTTARIPFQTFETNDRAAVAIVFERINRLGVELDTLQLLSAWSWSEDFLGGRPPRSTRPNSPPSGGRADRNRDEISIGAQNRPRPGFTPCGRARRACSSLTLRPPHRAACTETGRRDRFRGFFWSGSAGRCRSVQGGP
jgi:hypothetical protein